ncbi:hypothetical protein LCL96_02045 [Rossellomorea aquimaris]|uniref:hypothetical protein n=1 Tax=Rossellomorea aquimaris TaxID=189382 RepID=UPI001CD52E5D|nr:hypothetical protein [Rossellomorea aquimaris]MCA1057694.1 hypothetical protein [Rossellomorea aquimaris]
MTKRKKVLAFILLIAVVFVALPPLLAPKIHDHDSPRSALREAIYKDGHPYQSFFAFIKKEDYQDQEYGQQYHVYWYDYNSPTGETASICYAKANENEEYEVACGTGP